MEIVITLVVLGLVAYWVYDMSQKKKETKLDQPWPFGTVLPEGKIHVKTTDVAGSENRVEEPAPSTVAETVTTVVENKPAKKPAAKKAPAKKTAAKPAAAKRAPAKKKST